MRRTVLVLGMSVLATGSALRAHKIEGPFKNLQVLPKDIPAEQLEKTMDGFTGELGVKCTFCHIGEEYERDDRGHKRIARKMILLVQHMRANKAMYFKDDVKDEEISCGTCHRGKSEPEAFVP